MTTGSGEPGTRGVARRAGGETAAYALLTVAALFWAGNIVLGRALAGQIGPIELSFWRWLVASVVVLPLAGGRLWRRRDLLRRHWLRLALLSFLLVVSGNTLIYVAVTTTTATNAALVNAAQPTVILLLAWLLQRERLGAGQWCGVVLSLAGVLLTITRADLQILLALGANVGDLWMMVAVFSFALYSLHLRDAPRGLTTIDLVAVLSVLGLVTLIPFLSWEASSSATDWSWPLVAGIVYAGCFASVAGISAWNAGVAAVGASRAGLFLNLIPVFAAVVGIATLGEALAWFHVVSFGCIAVGMWMALRPFRR